MFIYLLLLIYPAKYQHWPFNNKCKTIRHKKLLMQFVLQFEIQVVRGSCNVGVVWGGCVAYMNPCMYACMWVSTVLRGVLRVLSSSIPSPQ